MKGKIYLTRDCLGYDLYTSKPVFTGMRWVEGDEPMSYLIASSLCPKLVKSWLGLEKHLRKGTCIRGTFNVSFTPDKKKHKIKKTIIRKKRKVKK